MCILKRFDFYFWPIGLKRNGFLMGMFRWMSAIKTTFCIYFLLGNSKSITSSSQQNKKTLIFLASLICFLTYLPFITPEFVSIIPRQKLKQTTHDPEAGIKQPSSYKNCMRSDPLLRAESMLLFINEIIFHSGRFRMVFEVQMPLRKFTLLAIFPNLDFLITYWLIEHNDIEISQWYF